MVAAKIRGIHDAQAKERMEAGKKLMNNVRKSDPPEKIPEGIKGDSRDLAGRAVGVNGKYVDSTQPRSITLTPVDTRNQRQNVAEVSP